MNDTSAAGGQSGTSLLPDGIGTITSVFAVLVLLLAIATIAMIVYGARSKRARKVTNRHIEANAKEAGVGQRDADVADEASEDERPAAPAPGRSPSQRAAAEPATPPAPAPPVVERSPEEPPPPPPLADEPIPAAAPLDATPASIAGDAPAGDDPASGPVTLLKGLGPKVAARLAELGITTVGQLAVLSDAEAGDLDAQLGTFRGRLHRDRWVEQAHFLAAGDKAGFEAVFGRL